MINEQQLSELFSLLESFSTTDIISKRCLAVVIPFLCQYVYPPCDSNGNAQFITQEQCINIRDDVCEAEWKIAMPIAISTGQGNLLPVCEMFGTDPAAEYGSATAGNDTEPLRCHYQFKEFCGVCLPLCATFSQYPDQVEAAERVVLTITGTLVLISGLIFLIVSVIRPSEM